MAKIDLYDPKWVDMVFAGKNKEYGAYKLRKGTSGRNIKALLILVITAALVGGFLAWKVIQQKNAEAQQAYMEAMQLAKLQKEAQKQEKKEKKIEKPKEQPKKETPVTRQTQKFTAPVIKKDELVKEENQVKQMDMLDAKVAVGTENKEGVADRSAVAAREEVSSVAPPPPAEHKVVSNKVFDVVEVMPSFPGGNGALMSYLSSHIKYPAVAQEQGIQGRVVVSFVVERDGSITDVRTVRSVDPSLDREAERVVKGMPRWNPGKQNGSAVRVKYNVPVAFRLQ